MRPFRSALLLSVLAVAATASTYSTSAFAASTTPTTTSSSPFPSEFLTGSTSYPFTFTQPDGTTATVNSPPTRVVTADTPVFPVEELVALGVKPVGIEVYPASSEFDAGLFDSRGIPLSISSQIKSFTVVGSSPSAPDLETIAGLQPQLIVGTFGTETADYKQLEAIAPLASINDGAGSGTEDRGAGIEALPWYSNLRLLAQILDRQAQFNAFVSKFEDAAAAVRPSLTGKTVRLVSPSAGGEEVFVAGPDYYEVPILTYLGLTVPLVPSGGDFINGSNATDGNIELSLERASELTGQYLMVAGGGHGATGVALHAFLSNPVVKQLPSVKAGRVVITGPGTPTGYFPASGPYDELEAIPHLPAAFGVKG